MAALDVLANNVIVGDISVTCPKARNEDVDFFAAIVGFRRV